MVVVWIIEIIEAYPLDPLRGKAFRQAAQVIAGVVDEYYSGSR